MSRRDQMLLVVIVCVAAIAGYYLLLLSPKVKQSKDLGTQLSAVQARRQQAHANLLTALKAEADYPVNARALRRRTPAVPRVDSTSKLLRQVDASAARAGVNFAGITLASSSTPTPVTPAVPPGGAPKAKGVVPAIPPGYTTTPGPMPTVVYSTTFKGGYLQLQRFLGAMQHFVAAHRDVIRVRGRLVDVSAIQVTFRSVVVTMTAYLLPASDQAPVPVLRTTARAAAPNTQASGKTAATTTRGASG